MHGILAFDQSLWLKPYIDFNNGRRKQAKVELVTSPERLRKVLAKPSLKSLKIFDENLAAVVCKDCFDPK